MDDRRRIMEAVQTLRVWRSGERRAPHKPLLLLVVLGRWLQGHREVAFAEVEERLRPLLAQYAPPVRARHQPELPYWHLQRDRLWTVHGAEELSRQRGGFPRMRGLRRTSGALPDDIASALDADPGLLDEIVEALLEDHFPESLHDELRAATGLDRTRPMEGTPAFDEDAATTKVARRRDPEFRRQVLRAYEYRCAATGFRAALGSSYFGVQAAHVQWHSHGGPDIVANGLVLDPTMHVLFDRGAWSLTDDRRILVSAEFTGTDEATQRVRALHGRPLLAPLPGHEPIRVEFIRWHREARSGGVFRGPALDAA